LIQDGKLSYQHSVQKVLVRALNNKSSKVTWNACVAIAKVLSRPDKPMTKEIDLFYTVDTTKLLFDIIANRQNIKARIQASLTLLNYKTTSEFGGEDILPVAW
jgi:hypothetical protein